MSCELFAEWVVSDALADRRRAAEHAESCPACRSVIRGHQGLQDRVSFWRQDTRAPDHLEDRVRLAIATRSAARVENPVDGGTLRSGTRLRAGMWLALAASFLIGIGLGVFEIPAVSEGPQATRQLLAVPDLRIAKAEEEEQMRAILQLESRAVEILARASQAGLATHEAARLMEYRARIASLDVTIDDVRGFVDQNPGHPRARTMLLEAYKEKKKILRDVIAFEERSS